MLNFIFSLFRELIFTRREEYDFKSKHFKVGKVIFVAIVLLIALYAFLVTSVLFRVSLKNMQLHEKIMASEQCSFLLDDSDKNQPKGSSNSQKPPTEK